MTSKENSWLACVTFTLSVTVLSDGFVNNIELAKGPSECQRRRTSNVGWLSVSWPAQIFPENALMLETERKARWSF